MADVLCPELIGRDSEIRTLSAALRAAQGGRGGLAVLTGEPGIGKSRLVREVAAAASQRGAVAVVGRATPSGASTAYRPLTEAVAQSVRNRAFPADDELAPWLPALGAIVPSIATVSPADVSAAARGEAMILLLRRLAGPAGLLVVLEDLHWADPDTLAIVEYLADNLASEPVLCLVTCRTEPRSAGLDLVRRLHSRRCALHLPLVRLDDAQVARMARACLPEVADEVVARLQRIADGVPFLVEELLASPGVPTSFADTVQARIAGYSTDERLVIQAAAVLGRNFDYRLLPQVTGLGTEQVAVALERGVGSLLLTADGADFRFRHALTREAVAGGILPHRRSALAARALTAVAAAGSGARPGSLDLAADLAAQSGQAGRAAALLAESGRQSLRHGALATATATLQRAAGLLRSVDEPSGGDRTRSGSIEVDSLLVEALALAGRVDEAMAVGDELITELSSTDRGARDLVRSAEIQLRLAYAAVAATRWQVATQRLEAARLLLAADPQPELAVRADVLDAEVALAGDDIGRARRLAGAVLLSGRAEPQARCQAQQLIGRIERRHDLGAARVAFEQALATAEAAGLPVERMRALHELGTIELFDSVGVERLTQARAVAGQLGALSTAAVLDLQLAIAHTWRFELDDGAQYARSAISIAGRLGLAEVRTKAQYALAENYASRLDRVRMEECLARAAAVSPGEQYLEAFAWGCRGIADLLSGDWTGALDLFRPGIERLQSLPPAEPAQFRAWWPLTLAMAGDDTAQQAADQARASGVGVARANRGLLGYADAILAGRSGDPGEASRLAHAADADLSFAPVWPHVARLVAAAPALADGWGQPQSWLVTAAECFQARGLNALAQRCSDLLAGSRPSPWARLGVTRREADVLALVMEGLTNKDIATRLYLSPRTVEKHVESLLRKTGAASRTQLAMIAGRQPGTT